MDVTRAVSAYVLRLLGAVPGMKVLLLDEHTTPVVSTAQTHSALLAHDVFLTARLEHSGRDRMRHLRCIALLRPAPATLAALAAELRAPRYAEYHLAFTGALSKAAIEALAEADEHHVVKEVQEYFADYIPITPALFSLGWPAPPEQLWGATPHSWDSAALQRHTEGLTALLLSLKKRPVVRYERMSALAKKLGEEVVYQMQTALPALFDFRRTDVPPLLLVLDRRNDPVTPLLSQWTYQAMVHELMGINNGRVSLPEGSAELREIVLSADQDPFFAQNLHDNFGDLGASIKRYVLDYQSRTASSSSIETVADMKRFVEEYPEFRKLGGNVAKHVALLGELSRRVETESLLEVSELEQSLASNESHAADLRNLNTLLASEKVLPDAKLRLAILYALRYQKYAGNQISAIVRRLLQSGVPESRAALVFVMLNLAGAEQRQDDLFANENFFSRGKSALKGLKGVENVYTQHSPHLLQTIEQLMKGRLRDTSYPYTGSAPPPGQPQQKPQDVIIFMVGGATYEEARTVALLNAQGTAGPGGGARFVLGGSTLLRSASYLDMLQDAASRFPAGIASPPPPSAAGAAAAPLNLSIGPVQLGDAYSGGAGSLLDPGRIGEAAEATRGFARGLLRNVQGALQ